MRTPILCLVTDRAAASGDLRAAVAAAVRGGVDWVQIRARELDGEALVEHADSLAAAARDAAAGRGFPVRILINRRVDVALAVRADGVQLGFDAMDAADARRLLGPEALIGVSAHAPQEAAAAGGAGASFALLAPVFAPLSKPSERPPLGPEALGELGCALPVLAQGGVDAARAGGLLRAGAAGVAVTGAILGAADPFAAARALRRALDAAAGGAE